MTGGGGSPHAGASGQRDETRRGRSSSRARMRGRVARTASASGRKNEYARGPLMAKRKASKRERTERRFVPQATTNPNARLRARRPRRRWRSARARGASSATCVRKRDRRAPRHTRPGSSRRAPSLLGVAIWIGTSSAARGSRGRRRRRRREGHHASHAVVARRGRERRRRTPSRCAARTKRAPALTLRFDAQGASPARSPGCSRRRAPACPTRSTCPDAVIDALGNAEQDGRRGRAVPAAPARRPALRRERRGHRLRARRARLSALRAHLPQGARAQDVRLRHVAWPGSARSRARDRRARHRGEQGHWRRVRRGAGARRASTSVYTTRRTRRARARCVARVVAAGAQGRGRCAPTSRRGTRASASSPRPRRRSVPSTTSSSTTASGRKPPSTQMTEAQYDETMNANVRGVFSVAGAAARRMKPRKTRPHPLHREHRRRSAARRSTRTTRPARARS